MKALITGAAGFIGSHLADRLLAEGHEIVGLDSFTDYYDPGIKAANLDAAHRVSRFSLIEGDMLEIDLTALVSSVDAVFHLAAQPGVRGSWGDRFAIYMRNNVAATQRLLEVLREAPKPTVVASSSSVYGNVERFPVREDDRPAPVSPYGVTKLAAENLACLYAYQYGIPVASVRYFTVYGPRQRPDMAFTRFLTAALAGEPLTIMGDGEQTRDFTYIADAVDATVRALDAPPGAFYNVGGGSRVTVNGVLHMIRELLERPVAVKHLPPVPGDARHTWADTSKIDSELGWRPSVSLVDGLAAQLNWIRSVGSAPGARADTHARVSAGSERLP